MGSARASSNLVGVVDFLFGVQQMAPSKNVLLEGAKNKTVVTAGIEPTTLPFKTNSLNHSDTVALTST